MRVGLLAVLMLLGACGGDQQLQPLAPGSVVLAFGDSLTYGTGAGRSASYPSVLSDLTGLTVINAGVPGEVTAQGRARLPELLAKHQPKLVILIHGGNDLLRRGSRAKAADNLRAMIELARDSGAGVVMLGVPAPGLLLRPAEFYGVVAEETDTPADLDALTDILQFPSNKADPVHPNAKGYEIWAEAMKAKVNTLGWWGEKELPRAFWRAIRD